MSSADYATSEASESTDDIWVINDEQREYYVKQFRGMQSDLTSTIKGELSLTTGMCVNMTPHTEDSFLHCERISQILKAFV